MISKEYSVLFNAITDTIDELYKAVNLINRAVNLLISAQIDAEEIFIEAEGDGN